MEAWKPEFILRIHIKVEETDLLKLSSDLYTCAMACMFTRTDIVHTHANNISSNYYYFIKRMIKGNLLLCLLAYEKQKRLKKKDASDS